MGEKNLNPKIIGNAISAYLMIFVCILFLFNKNNINIHHDFVKKHTKTALFLHTLLFLIYIIFISQGVAEIPVVADFTLNEILATFLSTGVLGVMLLGMKAARAGELFMPRELFHFSHDQEIISLQKESYKGDEREKMNILFAHLPFIGLYLYPSKQHDTYIVYATRLNLLVSVIGILLFNFDFTNLVLFGTLIYTIYVVFISMNMYVSGNIFQITLHDIFSPTKKFEYFQAIFFYLKDYFSSRELKKFSSYLTRVHESQELFIQKENNDILSLPDLKGPKFFIYIPIINFIYLFAKPNRYRSHIHNGYILSILFILSIGTLSLLGWSFGFLSFYFLIFISGIGYIHTTAVYKMPFVHVWFEIFENIFGKTKAANAKYNVTKEISLKVSAQDIPHNKTL